MNSSIKPTQTEVTSHMSDFEKRRTEETHLTPMPDSDCHNVAMCHALSLKNKQFTFSDRTSSIQRLDGKRCFNRSVVCLHILLVILSITLPSADASETCGTKIVMHTVHYNKCIPKTVLVPACVGTCLSYAINQQDDLKRIHTSCNCCQAVELRNVSVALKCPKLDGEIGYFRTVVKMKLPKTCACRSCPPRAETEAEKNLS